MFPVGPVGPVMPTGPVGPMGPVLSPEPVGPAGPVMSELPDAPRGPGSPGSPSPPTGPGRPCAPMPSGPALPRGPAGPGAPAGPKESQLTKAVYKVIQLKNYLRPCIKPHLRLVFYWQCCVYGYPRICYSHIQISPTAAHQCRCMPSHKLLSH